MVRRGVCDLRVTATALETGSQVLGCGSAGVGRWAMVVDVQQGGAAVHVWGQALQDRRASLVDRGVM